MYLLIWTMPRAIGVGDEKYYYYSPEPRDIALKLEQVLTQAGADNVQIIRAMPHLHPYPSQLRS